jgi:hypothetical protein
MYAPGTHLSPKHSLAGTHLVAGQQVACAAFHCLGRTISGRQKLGTPCATVATGLAGYQMTLAGCLADCTR